MNAQMRTLLLVSLCFNKRQTVTDDAEADAPILWPPDAESQLIRKDPDAGKD